MEVLKANTANFDEFTMIFLRVNGTISSENGRAAQDGLTALEAGNVEGGLPIGTRRSKITSTTTIVCSARKLVVYPVNVKRAKRENLKPRLTKRNLKK